VGRSERFGLLICVLLTAFSVSLLFVSIVINSETTTSFCCTGRGWSNSTSAYSTTPTTSQTFQASAAVSVLGLVYKFGLGEYAEASTYYGGGFKTFPLFSIITGALTLGTAFLVKSLVFGGDIQFLYYLYTFGVSKMTDWLFLNYVISKVKYWGASCVLPATSSAKHLLSKETTSPLPISPSSPSSQVPLHSFPPSSPSSTPYIPPPPNHSYQSSSPANSRVSAQNFTNGQYQQLPSTRYEDF